MGVTRGLLSFFFSFLSIKNVFLVTPILYSDLSFDLGTISWDNLMFGAKGQEKLEGVGVFFCFFWGGGSTTSSLFSFHPPLLSPLSPFTLVPFYPFTLLPFQPFLFFSFFLFFFFCFLSYFVHFFCDWIRGITVKG